MAGRRLGKRDALGRGELQVNLIPAGAGYILVNRVQSRDRRSERGYHDDGTAGDAAEGK